MTYQLTFACGEKGCRETAITLCETVGRRLNSFANEIRSLWACSALRNTLESTTPRALSTLRKFFGYAAQ